MIAQICISFRAERLATDPVFRVTQVELEPKFLPCLRIQEIAAKLAVEAFEEYLARQAEADEQVAMAEAEADEQVSGEQNETQ